MYLARLEQRKRGKENEYSRVWFDWDCPKMALLSLYLTGVKAGSSSRGCFSDPSRDSAAAWLPDFKSWAPLEAGTPYLALRFRIVHSPQDFLCWIPLHFQAVPLDRIWNGSRTTFPFRTHLWLPHWRGAQALPKQPGCFTLPMLFFPTLGNTSQCSEGPCFSPSLGLGLEGGPALPCPGGERWDSVQRQGALSPENLFPSVWRRAWKCSPLNLPLHPLFPQFRTFPYHITCF